MKRNQHKRPLHPDDCISSSKGCRHSNPDICKNAMTEHLCAFVRSDEICKAPPRSWPKLLEELRKTETVGEANDREADR